MLSAMLSAPMRRWLAPRTTSCGQRARTGRSEGGRLSFSSLLLSSLAGSGFFISRDDERFYGHAIRRRARCDDVTSHMGTARAAANGGQTTTVGRIFLPAVQRCLWGTSWFLLVRGRQQHSEQPCFSQPTATAATAMEGFCGLQRPATAAADSFGQLRTGA